MRTPLLSLAAATALLGLAAARSPAQTVVPFDLSRVTVAFYQGDGTSNTNWAAYDYTLVSYINSTLDQQVGISAGPGVGTNQWEFEAEIDFSNGPGRSPSDYLSGGPGRTDIFLRFNNPANLNTIGHPLANYDKIVIGGLFPQDPSYQLSGITFDPADDPWGFFPLNHNGTDVIFDGAAGTLTIYPQSPLVSSTIPWVNIFVEGQLLATEVSAVPEPAVATAVLAIGAAGFVIWRRRART
ncbi:MAG TPA: hypothetical protein VG710_02695 [Opitutus sp.]|nr:hypothetical protein [Opitutus sp.]